MQKTSLESSVMRRVGLFVVVVGLKIAFWVWVVTK